MLSKIHSKYDEKFVSKILSIIAVLTVVHYIVFSIIKRLIKIDQFYWLPVFLFTANFLILVELIYMVKKMKISCTKSEYKRVLGYTVLNFCFVVFILTYLF
jgi:hypothetical protein